jgi:general secretion pathway protein D
MKTAMPFRRALLLAAALLPAACEKPVTPVLTPLPPVAGDAGTTQPRINGIVGTPNATPAPQLSYGSSAPRIGGSSAGRATSSAGGDVSLDFADTDIREIVAQILGGMLQVNYTIDPSVHGTATLRTAQPLARDQLIPTLEALLAQNGATLVQSGALYRVVPVSAATAPLLADSGETAGSQVIPLRYASADELAKVLQPYVGTTGRVIADPGRNALLISGSPAVRAALLGLVSAFDIDVLANQSYALLPVTSGDAKDFASALQDAFRGQSGGSLAGLVRVVPMERVNAVLLVASQPRYVDDARRVYAMVERMRRDTVRSWHVLYLQTGRADDVAYVLQQAFTPNAVTAQPTGNAPGATLGGMQTQQISGTTGFSGMNSGSSAVGTGSVNTGSFNTGTTGTTGATQTGNTPAQSTQSGTGNGQFGLAAGNPLLGALSPTSAASSTGETDPNAMRIIPDRQTNAILSYATPREEDTIEAMLRKIDILPLQVRIDATIAEVDLNDQLQYGTQFYFKSGGINGILSTASQSLANTSPVAATLNSSFPGFVLAGNNNGGAPFAINALQQVTKVQVLSSPELMVLDGQPARLQVGNLVPYLSQQSQSTITSNSAIVNSVNYQATGVIMQVTPRVNKGGLVTMDISQEVSDVANGTTTQGLNSPTFTERSVTSRVVIQDGQTVGLAGLIRDNVQRGNQGIPYLKDIPLLGLLAGTQSNQRSRTELLVLITPHVIHDQRDARALTEDLRDQLLDSATTPAELRAMPPSGSIDPSAPLRHYLGAPN